jgi:hypothetical protein
MRITLDAEYGIYPTTLRDRGISCTSCAPSFWNASLGGLALQILRKRIFAPGARRNESREMTTAREGVAGCVRARVFGVGHAA